MDKRPAERCEKLSIYRASGPLDGYLAGTAGDHVLMTFAAALRVVCRPQAIGDGFDLFESETVIVERPKLDDVVLI